MYSIGISLIKTLDVSRCILSCSKDISSDQRGVLSRGVSSRGVLSRGVSSDIFVVNKKHSLDQIYLLL
jgi:hypothetical protein